MSSNAQNALSVQIQVLAALVFVIATYLFYQAYLHPLAQIPGPSSARFSGSWRNTRLQRGSWHDDILELHRKYGRVVRIAPNEVSVVDAKAMKQLYGPGTVAVKTLWYRTFDPDFVTSMFSERETKVHAHLRKRLSGAYSMSAILKYEPGIQEEIDELLHKLDNHAGKELSLSTWISAFAFDVVGQLGFGDTLGHMRTETDVMNVRATLLQGFQMQSSLGHYYISFGKYCWGQMNIVRNAVTMGLLQILKQPIPMQDFIDYGEKRITERRKAVEQGQGNDKDMLNHFLQMKRADGSPVTHPEILIETLSLLGAGADTVAIAIRHCIYEICRHPEVYQRLQGELDEFYTSEQLTTGITYNQTQTLPYLVAVCKEAIRRSPSITFQLPRYAPAGGLQVDGRFIPEGTEVGISPLAQNRDTAIWGADADEFRPERWLEDEERSKWLDSQNFAFGGNGPRMCIGRNMALVEIHKCIAQLFHHFDVKVSNIEKPWRSTSYFFAFQHDFLGTVTPRSQFPLPVST